MKYLSIVFIGAVLLIVFRFHYYDGWPIYIAFTCMLVIPIIYLAEPLEKFSKKVFANSWFARKLTLLLLIIFFLGLFMGSICANGGYCNYLLKGKVEFVSGKIVEELFISHRRGGPTKMLEYEYHYNNSKYCNRVHAEDYPFVINDTISLKISTLDPTVSKVIQ